MLYYIILSTASPASPERALQPLHARLLGARGSGAGTAFRLDAGCLRMDGFIDSCMYMGAYNSFMCIFMFTYEDKKYLHVVIYVYVYTYTCIF